MNDTLMVADLAEVAAQVAWGLAKSGVVEGRAFIRTPVLFPSGTTVVVVLEEEGGGGIGFRTLGRGGRRLSRSGLQGVTRGRRRRWRGFWG